MKRCGKGDVALNLYDFVVRQPGKPTEKYGLRAYDEVILAPMVSSLSPIFKLLSLIRQQCIFEPRVIEFDRKRIGMRPSSHPDVTEEIMEHPIDHVVSLLTVPEMHAFFNAVADASHGHINTTSLATPTDCCGRSCGPNVFTGAKWWVETAASVRLYDAYRCYPVLEDPGSEEDGTKQEHQEVALASTDGSTVPQASLVNGETDTSVPIEIIDVEGDSKLAPTGLPSGTQQNSTVSATDADSYAGGYAIDVCFEASKLPLDVAIFNSARAAGGDEKIRKYLQAVLVIGGTALVPGMAHALESRSVSILLHTLIKSAMPNPLVNLFI
jgi:actin-related protein 8